MSITRKHTYALICRNACFVYLIWATTTISQEDRNRLTSGCQLESVLLNPSPLKPLRFLGFDRLCERDCDIATASCSDAPRLLSPTPQIQRATNRHHSCPRRFRTSAWMIFTRLHGHLVELREHQHRLRGGPDLHIGVRIQLFQPLETRT